MKIEEIPIVLSWQGGQPLLSALHATYVERLLEHLGLAMARIAEIDRRRGERLLSAVRELPDESLTRILTAPETSYRLLWPSCHRTEGVASFLEQSIHAERARLDGSCRADTEIWTALGDLRCAPEGTRLIATPLAGMMPVDFESPFSRAVEAAWGSAAAPVRDAFTGEEQRVVSERLAAAWIGIGRSSRSVQDFVLAFTKVLVVQKEATQAGFSSNSRDDRIGRSALRNPQLATVDEVDLADSLVHEAIHSLLYLHEHHHRWFRNAALYSPEERVRSPWSGNRLPVRYWFHACFVWYGLLHFWCAALASDAFRSRGRVRAALMRAARGFLGPPITARLAEWRADIDPLLLETIDLLQAHVITSLGDDS